MSIDMYGPKVAEASALIREFAKTEYFHYFARDPESSLEEFIAMLDQAEEKGRQAQAARIAEMELELAELRAALAVESAALADAVRHVGNLKEQAASATPAQQDALHEKRMETAKAEIKYWKAKACAQPSPSSVGDAIRAMPLPEKIEWSYSTNGENYYGTEESREDAIALALEEIGETEGTFWIGKSKRHFGRGTYIAGSVIEQLQEQAYEDCGEFAETYLDDVTKEEEAELADFITDWAARVDRSHFWTVYDTEQIDIAVVLTQDGQKSEADRG